MKKIILLGGAPTVGKSYLAERLAKHLDMPWISTDTIREMMRKLVNFGEYPHLANTRSHTAETYLNTFSAEEIMQNQIAESHDVWKGVAALVDTDYVWDSFIVEGVGIVPELVHATYKDNPVIKPVFLVSTNKERVREVVFTRGLWDSADTYLDSVKEKEVEWAYAMSMWMKEEAEKYNFPVYEVKGLDFPIEDVSMLCK